MNEDQALQDDIYQDLKAKYQKMIEGDENKQKIEKAKIERKMETTLLIPTIDAVIKPKPKFSDSIETAIPKLTPIHALIPNNIIKNIFRPMGK